MSSVLQDQYQETDGEISEEEVKENQNWMSSNKEKTKRVNHSKPKKKKKKGQFLQVNKEPLNG